MSVAKLNGWVAFAVRRLLNKEKSEGYGLKAYAERYGKMVETVTNE